MLRTPIYSAHPINGRQIAPHDRFTKHIDLGERRFSFRITTEENVARAAQIYNEEPWLMSFFPSGEGEAKGSVITIDNPEIILSSFKKKNEGYELNLYNVSDKENDAEIIVMGKKINLHFRRHELKSIYN